MEIFNPNPIDCSGLLKGKSIFVLDEIALLRESIRTETFEERWLCFRNWTRIVQKISEVREIVPLVKDEIGRNRVCSLDFEGASDALPTMIQLSILGGTRYGIGPRIPFWVEPSVSPVDLWDMGTGTSGSVLCWLSVLVLGVKTQSFWRPTIVYSVTI